MALVALAIPILPDKKEQWQRFIKELQGPRRSEFVESRKKLGVHERTFHQETPMGDFVVVTLEGANPAAAFDGFTRDNSPFAQWMKAQVKEIHGIDLAAQAPPIPRLIVDTEA